jgi:xanthine dehydrogenase YagS FAD-binding subunit
MKNFTFVNALTTDDAIEALGTKWTDALVMAGGQDLLGEMKEDVVNADRVVNLKQISGLDKISYSSMKGLDIGATVTLDTIANHPDVKRHYPGLAQAANIVATPQIRNVGTLGGNLCQRPRCWYYRDPDVPCWRKDGDTCFAVMGNSTYHAVLGGGPCYIVAPSDVAPMVVALGGTIHIMGPKGARAVPADEFFVLPTENRHRENVLQPNEIVTNVTLPVLAANTRSLYVKHEERTSWDFAIASVAVVLEMDGRECRKANIVLGGAAPKPWVSKEANNAIVGKAVTNANAQAAAEAAVDDAVPLQNNEYKIPLLTNMIRQALHDASWA